MEYLELAGLISCKKLWFGVFWCLNFQIDLNYVLVIWSFIWRHVHQVGKVLLIYFLPLVDECYWDLRIFVLWKNDVWCLVADLLIILLIVVVLLHGNHKYSALIVRCRWSKVASVSFGVPYDWALVLSLVTVKNTFILKIFHLWSSLCREVSIELLSPMFGA